MLKVYDIDSKAITRVIKCYDDDSIGLLTMSDDGDLVAVEGTVFN